MSSVGEPPVHAFDATALAKVKADNGGKINTVKAIQEIEAGIRSDGKVTADEIELFTATMNGVAGAAKAPFEVSAAEFGFERSMALAPDQTIPGSEIIVGTPAQYADPMAMINDVGQLDELDVTANDDFRCGATAIMYEACFMGPDAMQGLIDAVRTHPSVDPAVKEGLKGVDVRTGNISRKTFHLAIEALYTSLKHVDPIAGGHGLSGIIVGTALQASGLNPTLSNAPPAGLKVGQRAMVLGAPSPGSAVRHWTIIGHDTKGFYRMDPAANNNKGKSSEGNSVHRFKSEADMQAYVQARAFDFGADKTLTGGKVGVVTLTMGN